MMNRFYEKALSMKQALCSDVPTVGNAQAVFDVLWSVGCRQLVETPEGLLCTLGQGKKTLLITESNDSGMLFAAAKLMKACEEELGGCVKLLLRTLAKGKVPTSVITPEGLPQTDAAMVLTLHHCTAPSHQGGRVLYALPDSHTLRQEFELRIKAVPGIRRTNPLNIALRVNLALHELMAQDFPPHEMVSVRCGMLDAGKVANAAAEIGILRGVVRARDAAMMPEVKKRLEGTFKETVNAFQAEAEVEWLNAYPALAVDRKLTKLLMGAISDVLCKENVIESLGGSRGDEFALCSQNIPFIYFEYCFKDDLREEELLQGAAAITNCAFEYFLGGTGK